MQKNNTHKKLKIMIPHHEYWTTYLRAIQKALSNEYYYYKTGTIAAEKLDDVLIKLNDYYRLDETPKERFNRFKSGFSVVVIHLLKVADTYHFILMARSNESKTGLFFEREKYADATDKKHRISFNECYEFVRINKSGYEFEKKQKKYESDSLKNKTEYFKKQSELEKITAKEKEAFTKETLGRIASLSQANNSVLASIGKAAAIAQIAIDTPVAIAHAIASNLPYPTNFAAAGLVGVAMAAQASKIAGLNFEQGGIVPGSSFTGDNVRANDL